MKVINFTCLIPAFNEAPRIAAVLDAVIGHPLLTEVIVIDDGSTDCTGEVARAKGARVLNTQGNAGKTHALVRGLQEVTTSHAVLIDADLRGLTASAVTALIDPIAGGAAEASISLRGNAPRTWRLIGLDYISGERVIACTVLRGKEEQLAALPRFGFEVFLNDQLIQLRATIAVVDWPAVSSPAKAAKRGLLKGAMADVAMMTDIFYTIGPVHCLRQIRALLRLKRPPSPQA